MAAAIVLALLPVVSLAQLGQRRRALGQPPPQTRQNPPSGTERPGDRGAPGGAAPRVPNRGAFLARALRQLDLTPVQVRSIRQVRGRFDTQMRELGRRFLDARRQLDTIDVRDKAGQDRAMAVGSEIGKMAGERATTRTMIELEVLQTLTAVQRARLRDMRAAARQQFDANFGAALRNRRRGQPGAEQSGQTEQAAGATDVGPAAPPAGTGDGADSRPGRIRKTPIRDLLDRLQLSPEQQIRMRQLRRQHAPIMRENNRRFRETQRDIDDALLADTIDAGLVRKLAGSLGEADSARTVERIRAEIEVQSILTPAQRDTWRAARLPGPDADQEPDVVP